jgi:hypothetical protein
MKTRPGLVGGSALAAGPARVGLRARARRGRDGHRDAGHFETTIDEDGKTRLRDRYVVSAPLAAC